MAQHDQVIDNGPGLTVRTDINAALAALFSTNSGPVEPTVAVAGQFWFDTADPDASKLWLRDAANAAWVPVFDVNTIDIGFGKRDMPDRFVWNDAADLSGKDVMTLETESGILTLAGTGTGPLDATLQSLNGVLEVGGVTSMGINEITIKGTGTTPKNYWIKSINGIMALGNAAGDGKVQMHNANIEKQALFIGTGTTPRDYYIQSINGVLLVQGTTGSIVQLSHGLVIGGGLSALSNVAITGTCSAASYSTAGGITAGGQIKTTSNLVTSTGVYALADATFGMLQSGAVRYITVIGTSYCFNCNGANGDMSWMQPGGYNWFARASDAAFIIRGQAYKPGGGGWIDASDSRIKTVLGTYDSGLDEILALRPIRYTFKGNDTTNLPEHKPEEPVMDEETGEMITPESRHKDAPTVPYWNSPHNLHAEQGTEFIGLIAQEAEIPMPEMVTQVSAHIDGQPVTDLRNLDTGPLIFALINAVKTLAARVEALETTNGTA